MDSTIAEPLGAHDPREIGPFPIIGRLGVGGMGAVYLGTSDTGYVAVKRVLSLQVSRERFKREVEVLYRVPEGAAPRVLAHDSTTERPWFATEYVPGLTLDDAVRRHGPLSANVLRLLLAGIIAPLHAVHRADIVHRDLKPANLMLVRDGVKLIDFGIARAADLPRLTRYGSGFGTRGYSAPEQENGDSKVASPADIYSVATVLLYAATGTEPDDVPDIAPLREKDAELAAVVESCLAVIPAARPTAAQLVTAARGLTDGSAVSWPAEVAERIEARRAFVRTPVGKLSTVPPEPAPGPEPVPRPDQNASRQSGSGQVRPHAAATELAGQVRRQWEREERVRRVHDPYPLPVRFEAAAPGLFDHWANIRRTGRGVDPGPLALAGDLEQITAVYRSIPSERLVVLGQAGSGKTILALRFVLDRLSGYVQGDRVPVIFSLGSWDPTAVSLHDWMCRRLVRDYNDLEAPAGVGGGNTAAALIDDNRILPVLDGFDEIASGLRGPALTALNEYAGPLLLTSRPAEYALALQEHDVLTGAACIELGALRFDDIDEYLTRASRPTADPVPRTVWEPVLSRLRARPRTGGAANVADAFATPLMVALARAVYSDAPGRDPAELLRTDRFPTTESVQEHLLAEFVPASYRGLPADAEASTASRPRRRRRWDGERAEHWLGYLAWHMREQDRHDLAWWELGTVLGRRALMLVVGATVAVATGLVAGLVYGTAAALSHGPATGLGTAIGAGIMNGLGVGLTFGIMHGFASNLKVGGPVFEPSHMRIQLRGGSRRKLLAGFAPRVGAGLLGGVLFGVVWATGSTLYSLAVPDSSRLAIVVQASDDLALGTGLGLAIGLVAALGTGLEAVSDRGKAARPAALLTTNRINVLTQLTAVAVVIGVGYGAVLGPAPGLAAGLMVALGLGTMTAWGRWVVLARIWLPLRGLAPWAMAAFLEDAYRRGVLRQAGAVYQLRHDRIQIQLADKFEAARHTGVREQEQP